MKLLSILIIINIISSILSKSYTYSSTFEIKGGIKTKKTWECSSTPTFKVIIGIDECEAPIDRGFTLDVYLEKKGKITSVSNGCVNLHYGGEVTLEGDGEGEYYIYLHHSTGHRVKGSIDIDITC